MRNGSLVSDKPRVHLAREARLLYDLEKETSDHRNGCSRVLAPEV